MGNLFEKNQRKSKDVGRSNARADGSHGDENAVRHDQALLHRLRDELPRRRTHHRREVMPAELRSARPASLLSHGSDPGYYSAEDWRWNGRPIFLKTMIKVATMPHDEHFHPFLSKY